MNNTTRRHPRTLQEAFGPYCSREIAEPSTTRQRLADLAYAVVFVAACALIAAMLATEI